MNGPWLLLVHSLKRMRALLLAMAVLLGLFQFLLILIATALERSHAFASITQMLPPFAREFLGASAANFISFGGMVCQGYFHPVVIGSLVGLSIAIATMPTSEIESGFMDLLLSRPLARHWIMTRAILLTVFCAVLLLTVMVLCTWAGMSTFAPRSAVAPSMRTILSMAINLGLLMLCWSGIAMAIGAASRRRGVAGSIAGLLALTAFLTDYLARAWPPAESVAWLSPFRYYNALELIRGFAIHPHDLLVLGGIAGAGFILAYVLFSRRDLSR